MLEGIKVLSENYVKILPDGWWLLLFIGAIGCVIGIAGVILTCYERALGEIIVTSIKLQRI